MWSEINELTRIAGVYFSCSDKQEARRIFAIIETLILENFDVESTSKRLYALVAFRARLGDIEGAKQTVRSMLNPYQKEDAEQLIVKKLLDDGNVTKAIEAAKEFSSLYGTSVSCLMIGEVLLSSDKAKGREFFALAEQLAEGLKFPYRKVNALRNLIEVLAKHGAKKKLGE